MFCPVCKSEYRQGITICPDCNAALVPQLSPAPGESEDDPLCKFWSGDDPRRHAEVCALLDEAEIPHKTIRREDHLFNIARQDALRIGVPFSLYEKAKAAVYGDVELETSEPTSTNTEGITQEEEPERPSKFEQTLVRRGLFAAVAEKLAELGSPEERLDWDPSDWNPSDATVELWSGDDPALAEMVSASLRENRIHSYAAELHGKHLLYVLPADEARAREILREITEASPPE